MKQLTILLILLFPLLTFGQFGPCNNIHTIDNYYREVPKITGGHVWEEKFLIEETQTEYISSFASNLWVGAADPGGNLRLSVQDYSQSEPGPLKDGTGLPFQNACDYFDRAWTISGAEIIMHKARYEQGTISLLNTPKDIIEWPAKGNIHFDIGEENGEILDQNLAPFFDVNGDGVYNALDGDIPIYKSEVEFQNIEDVWSPYIFSLSIINDANSAIDFNADQLKLEILQSSYLMNCEENQELNYSVFHSFKITYKDEEPLSDLRIAYWEDVDFGCIENDLIGCSPALNTAYTYNADPVEFCSSSFEQAIDVAWGMTKNTILLSHDMRSFMYYNNPNVGLPDPNTVDPSIGFQYYNYLQGLWLDGTPMTVGGSGFNPGSTDETKFLFSDFPNETNGWSMANLSLPFGDRRTVIGIDTQESISPGESIVIDLASHVLIDIVTTHFNVFEVFEEHVEMVKQAYEMMETNPESLNECAGNFICTDDCVWPGNILPDDRVDGKDILLYGAILGKGWSNDNERNVKGGLWAPHDAEDWDEELNAYNLKHADCNGNGELSEEDVLVFAKNFGLEKPEASEFENKIAAHDTEGFNIQLDKSMIDLDGSFIQRIIEVKVRPKENGESFDFEYHGVSFDLVFDTSLVALFGGFDISINENYFTESIYENSFFKADLSGESSFELEGDNRVTFVLTSGSGEDQSPNEEIVNSFSLIVKESAYTYNLDGRDTIQIAMENIVFMDAEGNILEEVGYYSDELIITNLEVQEEEEEPSSLAEVSNGFSFSIHPNPASNQIIVETNAKMNGFIRIFDLAGKEIVTKNIDNKIEAVVELTSFDNGLYFIQLIDDAGKLIDTDKFFVTK